tara:strand:+ start:653 stop:766 length:114 start_codon:yes stop_codon:yes gene_type:complete
VNGFILFQGKKMSKYEMLEAIVMIIMMGAFTVGMMFL